jgi:hypothetical protein
VEHAERVVKEGFKKLGWKQADLPATRKEYPRKVKLALRLRPETTATIKRIAQRSQMGSWTHANHLYTGTGRNRNDSEWQILRD